MSFEEYRAPARILSTSPAGNIVAEVTQDLLVRWPRLHGPSVPLLTAAQSLFQLGQYITTFRVRTTREGVLREEEFERMQRNFVDRAAHWVSSSLRWPRADRRLLGIVEKRDADVFTAILMVAEKVGAGGNTECLLAALSLAAGIVVAFRRESVVDPIVDRSAQAFALLLRQVCKAAPAAAIKSVYTSEQVDVVLSAVANVVPVVSNSVGHMRELVKDGCVLDVCAAAVFDPTDGLLSTAGRGTEAHAQRVLGHPIVSDIGNLAHALTLLVACPATSFASTRRLVGLLHSAATALLLEFEQSTRDPFASPLLAQFLATNLMAALTLLESILQRFYVDDAYLGVKEHDLVEAWNVVVDTMASLHFITLSFGRDGVDVFKRASTLAIQFILRRPAHIVDQATSRLFAAQPCLTYMASSGRSLKAISRMRSYLVLFYLDLTEHLVPHLSAQSLANLALPLASRYAGHEAIREVGPEWFESAHAVILAVLELVAAEDSAVNDGAKRRKAEAVLEVVPWYTDLLLQLYPNSGISADLLRIAYTAAVRAATTNNAHSNVRVPLPKDEKVVVDFNVGYALAWDRVLRLMARVDELSGPRKGKVGSVVDGVRRRDLLLVLVEQTTTVPLVLLPRLMKEIGDRVVREEDWATRNAAVDAVQEIVLSRADVARKPALSTWVWQLRSDVNGLLDHSKM